MDERLLLFTRLLRHLGADSKDDALGSFSWFVLWRVPKNEHKEIIPERAVGRVRVNRRIRSHSPSPVKKNGAHLCTPFGHTLFLGHTEPNVIDIDIRLLCAFLHLDVDAQMIELMRIKISARRQTAAQSQPQLIPAGLCDVVPHAP